MQLTKLTKTAEGGCGEKCQVHQWGQLQIAVLQKNVNPNISMSISVLQEFSSHYLGSWLFPCAIQLTLWVLHICYILMSDSFVPNISELAFHDLLKQPAHGMVGHACSRWNQLQSQETMHGINGMEWQGPPRGWEHESQIWVVINIGVHLFLIETR